MWTLDVEDFQELGAAFQAAHGGAKHVDFSANRKKVLPRFARRRLFHHVGLEGGSQTRRRRHRKNFKNVAGRTTFIRVRGTTMFQLLKERTP